MENNKQVNFEEVIFSSSQKSIITDMSGFGVRTHSAHITEGLPDTLFSNGLFSYELSSDRMVGKQQLQDNPRIVYDYPETYIYKKIKLDSGKERYIFLRTIYIGIDYGYFCDGGNQRTGSNYFSHALVFDEKPPKEVFNIIANNNAYLNNVFLPLDYTCSPNNKELIALLTGDPVLLPPNCFSITPNRHEQFTVTEYMGLVITGVLQMYINGRSNSGDEVKKLIVKADKDLTKDILHIIKVFIPQPISSELTFTTNYNKDGVPDDIDIVFVNQFYDGTLYEDRNICIDLLNGQHTGIEQNFLFDKIQELIRSNEVKTLQSLLEYIAEINIDNNSDFKFLYNIFVLTKSDKEVLLTDLTSEFIRKLAAANLSGNNKGVVWSKISDIINNGLQSDRGKEIIATLSLIGLLKDNDLEREINISVSAKEHFSKILFDTSDYFGRIVNADNISIVPQIVIPNIIGSTDRLFGSLETTDKKEIWSAFIRMSFPGNEKLTSNAHLIISKVAASQLSSTSQKDLLLQLYPISGSGEQVFLKYFTDNPNQISKYSDILLQLCRKKPQDYYPQLMIVSAANQAAFSIVSSGFVQLFDEKVGNNENTYSVFGDFLAIIKAVPKGISAKLNLGHLVQSFVDSIFNNPSDKYKSQIEELLDSGLKINAEKQAMLYAILSILNNEIPKEVNVKTVTLAYRLSKKGVSKDLIDEWIKQGFTNKDLLQFIESTSKLSNNPQLINHLILSIWKTSSANVKTNRKILVETIIHNLKWKKDDRNKFLKSGIPEDLAAFIKKSLGFFNKLSRKLFNIK